MENIKELWRGVRKGGNMDLCLIFKPEIHYTRTCNSKMAILVDNSNISMPWSFDVDRNEAVAFFALLSSNL